MSADATGITFVGVFDPDPKKPAAEKLAGALARFAAKSGQPADICLTSLTDAEAITAPPEGVLVEGRAYIAASTYYVGVMPT